MMQSILLNGLLIALGSALAAETPRVVALDGAVTETVVALGKADWLVGRDDSSEYLSEVREVPSVGYVRSIPAEGVMSLAPTLVIASRSLSPRSAVEVWEKAGIRVEIVEAPGSLADITELVQEIGEILDTEDRAEELAAELEAKRERLASLVPSGVSPRMMVVMSTQGSPRVAGSRTRAQAMIEALGGENAFTEHPGYAAINVEAVLTRSPEIVLFAGNDGADTDYSDLLRGNVWLQALMREREVRIEVIGLGRFLSFGPGTVESLLELAEELYGQEVERD